MKQRKAVGSSRHVQEIHDDEDSVLLLFSASFDGDVGCVGSIGSGSGGGNSNSDGLH